MTADSAASCAERRPGMIPCDMRVGSSTVRAALPPENQRCSYTVTKGVLAGQC